MKTAPAPWGIGFASDDSKVQIISADGLHLAYIEQDPIYPNARLIAAAPELLAMLKAVNDAFYAKGTRKALLAALDGSRDLIRKAEGRVKT